jgi:hypothetical protein
MRPSPVRAQLRAKTQPTPRRETKTPLKKLEVRYPAVEETSKRPIASRGRAKSARTVGQATPKRPSGNPSEMNARNMRAMSPRRER